jgi:glycosyltransferase involved in cell wall biosynthesis
MRIALFSSYLPFVNGCGRLIVEWLDQKLRERGHQVESIYLPFSDHPQDVLSQMTAFRAVKIDGVDRVICFCAPAYLVQHPNKVLWLHDFRAFYDLWNIDGAPPHTPYYESLRRAIFRADGIALREARAIFTNSRIVQKRLKTFNNVDSSVLYPPLLDPTTYANTGYGEEVVYVSRLAPHKRQRLLLEAMAHTQTAVKARICGRGEIGGAYAEELLRLASSIGVSERVLIENRRISEQEKCEIIGRSLAVAYFPLDGDSYGYSLLEGAHSCKPLLATTDSGGVLEFVAHERNGLVCDPDAKAIAESLDRLYSNRKLVEDLGCEANKTVEKLRINWDSVIHDLLA